MGLPSPSALENKSSSLPEVIPTSLSAVPHAAKNGKYGSMAIVATAIGMIAMATGLNAICFLRYAPSVAKIPRFHSSPTKTGQCIAAIATIRSD